MTDKKSELEFELEELFDIKSAKQREEKRLNLESMEVQKEIRLLTHMFRDEVPDVTIPVTDSESIRWDFKLQKLLYLSGAETFVLETTSRQTMIRLRPHLTQLVRQAKDFFKD